MIVIKKVQNVKTCLIYVAYGSTVFKSSTVLVVALNSFSNIFMGFLASSSTTGTCDNCIYDEFILVQGPIYFELKYIYAAYTESQSYGTRLLGACVLLTAADFFFKKKKVNCTTILSAFWQNLSGQNNKEKKSYFCGSTKI